MLEIDFEPDGSEHLISCCLHPSQHIAGYAESGECLMCYGYYSEDERTKVSSCHCGFEHIPLNGV
jgi:hypothetical protein